MRCSPQYWVFEQLFPSWGYCLELYEAWPCWRKCHEAGFESVKAPIAPPLLGAWFEDLSSWLLLLPPCFHSATADANPE